MQEAMRGQINKSRIRQMQSYNHLISFCEISRKPRPLDSVSQNGQFKESSADQCIEFSRLGLQSDEGKDRIQIQSEGELKQEMSDKYKRVQSESDYPRIGHRL